MPITASAAIPSIFPLGFRIAPILAAINLLWGLIGTYIGFFNPRYAIAFVLRPARRFIRRLPCSARSPRSISACCSTSGSVCLHWAIVLPAWAIGLYALWRKQG